jgi:hypothetical protein
MKAKKKEKKTTNTKANIPSKFIHDKDQLTAFSHHNQHLKRAMGFHNPKQQQVNSDPIFQHKDYRKNTKGYDKLTGEIEKRGRPADNQEEIFLKKPEKDETFAQIKKTKMKNDAKKREALNKKLYKDRLKTKWDRGW